MLPYSPPDISSLYYPSLNTDICISLHMPNVPKVRLLSATRLLFKVLFLLTLPRRPRSSVLRTAKELPTTVLRLRRVSYAQASRVLSPAPALPNSRSSYYYFCYLPPPFSRVRCDLKDLQAANPHAGHAACSNCQERGLKCVYVSALSPSRPCAFRPKKGAQLYPYSSPPPHPMNSLFLPATTPSVSLCRP